MKLHCNDKKAFEERLRFWLMMRDAAGDGSWNSVANLLGAEQYVNGTKRIKKKRLRKYMTRLVMRDLFAEGKCTWG